MSNSQNTSQFKLCENIAIMNNINNNLIDNEYSNKFNLLNNKTKDIVNKLSSVLLKIIMPYGDNNNSNVSNYNYKFNLKSSFDANIISSLSLKNYISRIVYYSQVNNSTIIISLIYLDRYLNNSNICLTENNVYLLILTSLHLSTKMNEDKLLKDKDYSYVGSIENKLLIYNESLFLTTIKYNTYVSNTEFNNYNNYFN